MGLWIGTAVALLLLAAIATIGLTGFRIAQPRAALLALARAVLQLGALSLVLTGILKDPLWVGIGLTVMFVAAVGTAVRRSRSALIPLAASMLLGPLVVMATVFATGAIEFSPRYVLAIGGIVIGNTMTIAILTQRVFPNLGTRSLGRGRGMARPRRDAAPIDSRPRSPRDPHRTASVDRPDPHHGNRGSAWSFRRRDFRGRFAPRGRSLPGSGARLHSGGRRAHERDPHPTERLGGRAPARFDGVLRRVSPCRAWFSSKNRRSACPTLPGCLAD